MAAKICSEFNLANVCIPGTYKSKDVSDLIKNHSITVAKQLIDKEIWTNSNESTQSYTSVPF